MKFIHVLSGTLSFIGLCSIVLATPNAPTPSQPPQPQLPPVVAVYLCNGPELDGYCRFDFVLASPDENNPICGKLPLH